MTAEDPLHLITTPPRTPGTGNTNATTPAIVVVKVQGSPNEGWNGKLGIVKSYHETRDRYDVEISVGRGGGNILFPTFTTIAVRPQHINVHPTPSEIRQVHLLRLAATYHHILPVLFLLLVTSLIYVVYFYYDQNINIGSRKGLSRQQLWSFGIFLLVVMILFWKPTRTPELFGGDGARRPPPPPQQQPPGQPRIVGIRTYPPHRPDDDGDDDGSNSANPFRGGGWNWKKLLVLIVGALVLSKIDPRSVSDKILDALGGAYNVGYHHGVETSQNDNTNSFQTLQQQYDAADPKPPEGSLVGQFRPLDEKNHHDNNNVEFTISFLYGLEAFYKLGFEDGVSGKEYGASVNKEMEQYISEESGLLPYL